MYLKRTRTLVTAILVFFLMISGLFGENSVFADPVFPPSNTGLIFFEGEEAVATNFNTSPTINYSASGSGTLQLNSGTAPASGGVYYAEYAFLVQEEGEYDIWYGGTPPGPEDDLLASYGSPFSLIVDGSDPGPLHWEGVTVGATYAPALYWVHSGRIVLTRGIHRLRVEVTQPRRADGRYFLYLDCLFFAKTGFTGEQELERPLLFPESLEPVEKTAPFLSINDYEYLLAEDPSNISAGLNLARVYMFLGDYIGALRTLQKSLSKDPGNQEILSLMARNRLWKGDTAQSLAIYRQTLNLDPLQPDLWVEAGKVAAWSGLSREGIVFFQEGLKLFPDNLNLLVNQALVHYWLSEGEKGDELLARAEELTLNDPAEMVAFGKLLGTNGYPEKALEVYLGGQERFPSYLDFYFQEIRIYLQNGNLGNPDDVYSRISSRFSPSEELDGAVSLYRDKQDLRGRVIEEYTQRIKEDPDNLILRQALVELYFWNGLRNEAVQEYKSILANYTYLSLLALEEDLFPLLSLRDRILLYAARLNRIPREVTALKNELRAARGELASAVKAVEKAPENTEAAGLLVEKKEKLALVLARGEALYSSYTGIETGAFGLLEEIETVRQTEKEESEGFSVLVKDLNWSADWDPVLAELEETSAWEPEISDFSRGKILQYTGSLGTAELIFKQRIENDPPAEMVFGLYETLLWQKREQEAGDLLTANQELLGEYSPFVLENLELMEWFSEEPPLTGFSSPDDDELALALTGRLEGLIPDSQKMSSGLILSETELAETIRKKLERNQFYLTQETAPLRFNLGDYQLDLGLNREAAGQFETVLKIDPWNLAAIYKSGVVRQRYGDWYGAMKNYQKVYFQNPDYENAVAYYNQLGRQYPDTQAFEAVTEADNSMIKLKAAAGFATAVNSYMGVKLDYLAQVERIYRTYGGIPASAYMVQTLGLEVPFKIPGWGVELTPGVGGYLQSYFFGEDFYFLPDEGVSVSEYLTSLETAPFFSVKGSFSRGPLSVWGKYDSCLKKDSLHPYRDRIREQNLEAEISSYFSFPGIPRLEVVSSRTYGLLELLDDGNIIGQAVQDASVGFLVSRDPRFLVHVNGTFNYQNSKTGSDGNYYTPLDLMEAKGGLRGTLTLHSRDWSRIFETSLWGSAGGFWETGSTDGETQSALKLEGLLSVAYSQGGNSTLYGNLYVSGSFDGGNLEENRYWQGAVTLGMKARMPRLLAE